MNTVRHNRITLVLGTIAGIVSAWGWFSLMTHSAHAPWPIAVLSIACLELFVLGMAIHATQVANDGDSPAPYTVAITVVAIVAMALQFAAAISEGWGPIVGTLLAFAPLAAITLWVAHVRRLFRLRGRAAGTVAQPAATIEASLWFRFPKAAAHAKRLLLIDRTLGADDAMKLGILNTQPKPRREIEAPVRVSRNIAVEDVLPELRTVGQSQAALNGSTR